MKKIEISWPQVWAYLKSKIVIIGGLATAIVGIIGAVTLIRSYFPNYVTVEAHEASQNETMLALQQDQQSDRRHLIEIYNSVIDGLDDRIARQRAEVSRSGGSTPEAAAYLASLIRQRDRAQQKIDQILRELER